MVACTQFFFNPLINCLRIVCFCILSVRTSISIENPIIATRCPLGHQHVFINSLREIDGLNLTNPIDMNLLWRKFKQLISNPNGITFLFQSNIEPTYTPHLTLNHSFISIKLIYHVLKLSQSRL